jgi:ribonuclease Z
VHFFDIGSTKAKQFGFYLTLQNDEKFVCIGDEPCAPHCEAIARDCGWLLCEAFCRYADRERFRPYEKHHSTVRDACALAERLGVKNLVLWHTEDKTIDTRRERYTEEGAQFFTGCLYVPDDLDVISLS